jgi:hypothetical protein
VFSESKYLKQLVVPGADLYPSLKSKLNMQKLLRQQGISIGHMNPDTAENSNEQVMRFSNYLTDKVPHQRVSKKALTVVATWAEHHKRPVMLGSIPRPLQLHNMLQSYHLLDLQEMLR